jgi:hypothetical protein
VCIYLALDFIVVHKIPGREQEEKQIVGKDGQDATLIGTEQFVNNLEVHEQHALEAIFLPQELIILERNKDIKQSFVVDKERLRREVSRMVANSWSKAGKKMTIELDLKRYSPLL